MYKDLIEKIQKGELPGTRTFSEEEAKRAIKYFVMEKAQEYDYTPEELEKGFKNALKTGLSVLGLIHGAHYMGQTDGDKKQPQAKERSAKGISRSPAFKKPAIKENKEENKDKNKEKEKESKQPGDIPQN